MITLDCEEGINFIRMLSHLGKYCWTAGQELE
jgi:hypothetical protein